MTYTYCPNCGAKDSVIAEDITTSECNNCKQRFWNNPRATVAIVFIKDGQLLFSKRAIEPRKGTYDFPGGFLEYGEHPLEACIREIEEETSVVLTADQLELVATYASEYIPGTSVVDLIYIVRNWSGNFVPSDDSAALEWHPISFVNSNEFAPQYTDIETKLTPYL